MPSDRYRNLTPGAVAAALRSFDRRYLEALLSDPSRSLDEISAVRTRDGRTVRQVVADTAEATSQLAGALQQVLYGAPDQRLPAVASGEPVTGTDPTLRDVPEWLEVLSSMGHAIADRLEAVPPADLLRSAPAPGGGEVTTLDIARQAVRHGADNLLAIETAIGRREDGNGDD